MNSYDRMLDERELCCISERSPKHRQSAETTRKEKKRKEKTHNTLFPSIHKNKQKKTKKN